MSQLTPKHQFFDAMFSFLPSSRSSRKDNADFPHQRDDGVPFDFMRIEIQDRPLKERLGLSGIGEDICALLNDGLNTLLKSLPEGLRLWITQKDSVQGRAFLGTCALTFLSLIETGKLKAIPNATVADIVALLAVIGDRYIQMRFKNRANCVGGADRGVESGTVTCEAMSVDQAIGSGSSGIGLDVHRLKKALGSKRAFLFFVALKRLALGQVPSSSLRLKCPTKTLAQLNRSVWLSLIESLHEKETGQECDAFSEAHADIGRQLLTADVLELLLTANESEFAKLVLLEESPLTGQIRSGLIRIDLFVSRLRRLGLSSEELLTQQELINALLATDFVTGECLVTDPTQGLLAARTLANVCALEVNGKLLQRLLVAKADDAMLYGKSFGFQTFEALYRVPKLHDHPSSGVVLSIQGVSVALPLMPHPVITMIREALIAIESHIKVNPSLAAFYWVREGALLDTRHLTPQKACAIFIPQELLPMPEIFWTRRLIDAGVLVNASTFCERQSFSAVAMGQTIDAQVHALPVKERKAKSCTRIQQQLDDDTAAWPAVRPDTRAFVHGFVFRLSHSLESYSVEAIAALMSKRQQECHFRAMQVAIDLERRAESFLNPVAVKEMLKDYDADFMHFAQGLTLADLIESNPQVKLKLEMMDYHGQKKMRLAGRLEERLASSQEAFA